MDRQFWMCQNLTDYELLVSIEIQRNLHTCTREGRSRAQNSIDEARAGIGKVEVSRRPSWSSFLTPSAVQLTPLTHPLYEMIWVSNYTTVWSGSVKTASCSCSVPAPLSIHLPLTYTRPHGRRHNQPILRNPTGIDLLTYTPPLKIHTASFSYPNLRRSPHIRIPLTVYNTLFSATQPASISSHTPPPLTIHTASFSCPNQCRSPHIYSASPLFLPH